MHTAANSQLQPVVGSSCVWFLQRKLTLVCCERCGDLTSWTAGKQPGIWELAGDWFMKKKATGDDRDGENQKKIRGRRQTMGHFPVRNKFYFFGTFSPQNLLLMKVLSGTLVSVVWRFSGIFEALCCGRVLIDTLAAFHASTSPRVFKPLCGCKFVDFIYRSFT